MSLHCFSLLLLFQFTSSLFIYESNSQPRLIRPLPPLSLAQNQSISLILNDYFQGFNLSFLFNDLQDPFISFSMNQALGFSSPSNFPPGFFQVIPLDNRKFAIFSATQQIYTVELQQNQQEFTFSAIDFMNIDNDFLCLNMITLNSSKILLDCQRKSNQSAFLLTLFLDPTGKFLGNTIGISETQPPFANDTQLNTQLNMKYYFCDKKIVYKNGILLRYCPENPLVPDPSAIFSVVEVFAEKSDGIFSFFDLIDQEKLSLQLTIVELALFKVISSENFSFFLLDQVIGPCTIKYDNKTFKLSNDFPEILGDKKFLLKYKESDSIVFVVSSHYISEIEISPLDYGKSLKKRQNFGKEYNNIIEIQCNKDYYFVQVQNTDFTTYLDIFSRTHINTDLLYKIAVIPSERYIYLENTIGPSSWLLVYDVVSKTYRFLTVSELSVDISCCKMPITNDMLPYNRTLGFSAFNYDEFSNSKSLISESLNITISKWATQLKDALGFRFYLMNPSQTVLEKEFFFQYENMPPLSFNSQRLETCQNDYLSLGVQGDNDSFTSTDNSIGNILGVGRIMDTKKKLPLLKVTEMKVSLDGNMDDAKSYEDPLVLGFFNFSFMKTEINSEMQILQNFDDRKSFLTQAKLLYIDQEMFLQVTPDYSSLALSFTDNFLKDLPNNVTFFDLNKDDSLNLDGLFQGYVESYGFELENYTNNNSDFVLETFLEKPGSVFSDSDILLTETLDNTTNILFSSSEFSLLLKGEKIVLYGIPPRYNFTKIAELDLTNISPLFNYCSDFYLHDVQNIAVLICSIKKEESKPKRLIFLGFNSSGFSDLIRETPIPQYIQSISKLIFLENFYFIVERLTDSLNESLIHIFSLEPTQLTVWSPIGNSSRKVTNMVILNYKRLNAESLNVDYLLIYDFQVKILGRLGDFLVIGVLMSDYFCLYYAEFTINFNKNPVPFVGTINKLSRLELNTLLGNYSHSLDLRNGFDWLETNDFGELKLLIFDEFDLMEIRVSRFDLEPVVVRKYQSFYSCFHKGFTRVNTDFLVDVCEVSVEGYQEDTESLLQVYVKKERNLSIISQTLSFPKGSIINFDLQGPLLIIYLQNGTFLLYHLKQGVALKKTRQIQGTDIINGSFYARNRYSEARVFLRIIPGVFINEKVDVAFYLLIVVPIIISFAGIFTIFAMIQWNKKKRKEIFLEKYFRGAKTVV